MDNIRLIDTPVQNKEQESLGVSMYADVLGRFIMNCDTPITIGIQGDWGIGKTSLLNMIKENLSPVRGRTARYHTIYFNTWQYSQFSQEQFLGLSILKGILAEIQTLDTLQDLQKTETFKKTIKGFGKFVAKLGNQVVQEHSGLDFQAAYESDDFETFLENDVVVYLRKMKEEFSNLVKSLIQNEQDRLVIMIDDLDRIKPVKALEFLEAIKNFLDVEHCVFVMAVDYSVIQSGMEEKLGKSAQELEGKSYFDKIIQVPFTMPSSSYRTDNYIMSLLGWNYSAAENKYEQSGVNREKNFLAVRAKNIAPSIVDFFTNITSLTVGKNPRSIKRTVNYANLLRMIVQAQRVGKNLEWTLKEAQILYPLACMQLAWPELFFHFANDPKPDTLDRMQDFDYLNTLKGMDSLFKRVHAPEETKSNITGFIDEFIALVDTDGDGEISYEEFRPIWQMMRDADLTTSKYRSIDEDWGNLEELILINMGGKKDPGLIEKVFDLFRHDQSQWNDAKNFKLLSAGKKFYNIIWSGKQVGSIVTTQKEPIQLFLKGTCSGYSSEVSESIKGYLLDVSDIGHYGTGDTKVEILKISSQPTGVTIMNEIFDAMQKELFG